MKTMKKACPAARSSWNPRGDHLCLLFFCFLDMRSSYEERLLVAMNKSLAFETSLSLRGDLLDPLNKKLRGIRLGWFRVGVQLCCHETAFPSLARVLLASFSSRFFARARWLPAAPNPVLLT